jgi:hypothetical protein
MSEPESARAEEIRDSTARVPVMPVAERLAPNALLEDLFAMVSAEVAGAQTAEEGDALRVRAALIAWDGLGDKPRALEVLADAEHPLTTALRLGLASLPTQATDRGAASSIDQAVLSAFLFARGGYAEAAELANRAGPIAAIVRRVALGVLGSWDELVRDAQSDDGSDLLEEASSIANDRTSDVDGALALLRRLYESRPHPYVLERLLELSGEDVEEVLRRKLQLLEPTAAPERAATLYVLAHALEHRGGEGPHPCAFGRRGRCGAGLGGAGSSRRGAAGGQARRLEPRGRGMGSARR